jgi:hypothetical protein
MLRILDVAVSQNRPYVEFMIHSSELMPGGSPYFPSIESVEKLYRDLNELFSQAVKHCCGSTLTEFHDRVLLSSCSHYDGNADGRNRNDIDTGYHCRGRQHGERL